MFRELLLVLLIADGIFMLLLIRKIIRDHRKNTSPKKNENQLLKVTSRLKK